MILLAIMKRTFSCFIPGSLIFGFIFNLFPLFVCAQKKPNIIFLLADDMRYNSLGSKGNPIIQTPNLDQLVSKGTNFNNAFVTTPICCVSRASIFTGQYANRHEINDFVTDFTPEQLYNTYPQVLRRNGYYTGFIGKYGVGDSMPAKAFDYWKGFGGQGVYFYKDGNKDSIHSTDLMGNQSLEFISKRDRSKPFCLSVSFKAPHVQDGSPIHNGYIYSPFYENYYKNVTIPYGATNDDNYYNALPETFRVNERGIPNEARVRWGLRFSTEEKFQESVKSYYRLVTGIDDVVKRIVDELKKQQLEDNTIIIFSSDNGYSLGEHGMEGKWFGFNESLRVLTIVYDGRNPQPKHSVDDLVLNLDIAPTILDYANVSKPASMQGESLRPLVENTNNKLIPWRNEFYYNHSLETAGGRVYLPKSEGLVTKDYKYVRYYNGNNPNMYFYEDMFFTRTDPFEVDNLASKPGEATRKSGMIRRLAELRKSLD